jgi:hypothetical protein
MSREPETDGQQIPPTPSVGQLKEARPVAGLTYRPIFKTEVCPSHPRGRVNDFGGAFVFCAYCSRPLVKVPTRLLTATIRRDTMGG